MAQPQSNPKIEELRFRLKTDAKSRLFYPLAEELRKVSRFEESEQILRTGLEHHPTYLSAWVSLGRVLRDQHKNDGAAEALNKALQLDPGNVVAARLLADAYLDLGDKVEAIKKYKLVHALLPSDQDLPALIERLDRELHPIAPASVVEETPFAEEAAPPPAAEEQETPFAPPPTPMEDTRPQTTRPEPSFAVAAARLEVEHQATVERPFADDDTDDDTGDEEPMGAAHAESPFEQTAGYTAASLTVEKPLGFHVEQAPPAAEVPAVIEEEESPFAEPETEQEPAADVFAPADPVRATDDLTNTITMADLYAQQGLTDDARQIYENILQRDPGNGAVRDKLEALAPPAPPTSQQAAKVVKLQSWLSKVKHV
jgi:tetratricopeptide (TPR) repeat protein